MARAEHTPKAKPRRPHPVEALRGLARTIGGAATQGAASAAVRGAADGLREQLPDDDGQLQALMQDALQLVGRLVHQAALREQAAPGTFAHEAAAAAMRGVIEELDAAAQNRELPLHGLLNRLNVLIDHLSGFASSRQRELSAPGERARAEAAGIVDGAMDRLHEGMPTVLADLKTLAPAAGSIAYEVGHELLRGVEARAKDGSPALTQVMENAGAGLVRGVSRGLEAEALAQVMEQAGAGLVRGVSRGLAVELPALGARLRRPVALLAGGGALLVLGMALAAGRRRA